MLDKNGNKVIKSVHVSFSNSWQNDNEINDYDDDKYDEACSSSDDEVIERNFNSNSKLRKQKRVMFEYQDKTAAAPKDINLNVSPENIIERRLRSANNVYAAIEPMTFKEAMTSKDAEKWAVSIKSEFDSLQENKTFSELIALEDLPATVNLIDTKWVFKIKFDVNGKVDKYKSRLVGRGFSQQEGQDYDSDELYSPVTRIETIRIMFKLSLEKNMPITQMDIVTAYLYADMDKDLYISIPEGYENYDKVKDDYVLKLLKGLYGIKQSGRLWNCHITGSLRQIGFEISVNDPCLFILTNDDNIAYLAIYVDDILLSTNSEILRQEIETLLSKYYKVKQLGQVTSILRIRIICNEDSITMDLDQKVKNILDTYLEDPYHNSKVPMEESLNLPKGEKAVKLPFRNVLGSLLHLSNKIRPDLTFATSYLSRFTDAYDAEHWEHVQRLLS
jgi:hypothetical protein